MVRQHAGPNIRGDPRPRGVYDGIAAHGEGSGRQRDAAPEADWSDVRPRNDGGDEGTVLAFSAGIPERSCRRRAMDDALSRTALPDWGL